MAIDRSKPLSKITFYCKPCYSSFKAEPGRIEEAPEQDYHPFAYYAGCPKCGGECEQAPFERNLMKAWRNATGPRTEEGKAASAANLEGHPTPDEALRTRFNAMKHGLNARTATYFPAKPDGYSFCQGCEVDRTWCGQQSACTKQTEIFLQHHAAFEQRDPKKLNGIYADLQASIFAVIQSMLQTIIADGVKIETVVWDKDKDGQIHVAEYIDEAGQRRIIRSEVQAHPLLRQLGELLTRTGLSLTDMGMTAKMIEADDSDFGTLRDAGQPGENLSEFQEKQIQLLSGLAKQVMRANKQTENDPILIEYLQEGGE
jgi:hypothetical protein